MLLSLIPSAPNGDRGTFMDLVLVVTIGLILILSLVRFFNTEAIFGTGHPTDVGRICDRSLLVVGLLGFLVITFVATASPFLTLAIFIGVMGAIAVGMIATYIVIALLVRLRAALDRLTAPPPPPLELPSVAAARRMLGDGQLSDFDRALMEREHADE